MLIDGYNLLRAIENFSEHHEPITDVQLCMVLSRYLLRVKKKGKIVFDGAGPRDKVIFRNIRNLEVIFSGTNHEAFPGLQIDSVPQGTMPRWGESMSQRTQLPYYVVG